MGMGGHSNAVQRLKTEYLAYFEDVPVQKYAAMYIQRDEDTVIRWKKEDPEFADRVQRAKAIWIRKKAIAIKAEFALERLESEVFGRQNTGLEVSVNMPAPEVYLPADLPHEIVPTLASSESPG